jgi:5-methylcytosine-specific restriction endonuclease McrBC regulatory subunit McrC
MILRACIDGRASRLQRWPRRKAGYEMPVATIDVRERSTQSVTRAQFELMERNEAFWKLVEAGVVTLVRSRETPFGLRANALVGDALIDQNTKLRINEKTDGALKSLLLWSLPEDLRSVAITSPIASNGTILSIFAARFLEMLAAYLQKGRQKLYVRNWERSSLPRGRLDIAATIRLRARGNLTQVAQHRFVLSGDVLANQLLAAAVHEAEALLRSDSRNSEVLAAARLYSPILADVDAFRILRSTQRARADLFERALSEGRGFAELHNALLFARPLVLHSGIWASAVEGSVPDAYFLSLESLFEDAVRTVVRGLTSSQYKVVKGASLRPALFRALPERYIADPDIVFVSDQFKTVVADCKYKDLESTPSHSDVYQLLSHCTCLASNTGVLIYPGEISSCNKLGTTVGSVDVWCITARPTHLSEDLQQSLTALGLTDHCTPALGII